MNDEFQIIWKKTAVAYLKVLSGNSSGFTEENHENLSQCSRLPCRDSSWAPPEYTLSPETTYSAFASLPSRFFLFSFGPYLFFSLFFSSSLLRFLHFFFFYFFAIFFSFSVFVLSSLHFTFSKFSNFFILLSAMLSSSHFLITWPSYRRV
jgi:hypothetical protein